MTLIALTVNHGYPVLMADLLISSTDSPDEVELPTFVKGTGTLFARTRGYKPLGLKQKLYIVNDRLCVALGGRGDQMRTFLKRMTTFYGSIDFNDDELIEFVENYPAEESNELIAIVLKSKKDEHGYSFAVRCVGGLRMIANDRYEKVIAGGSGSRQFLEFIQTNPKFGTDIINSDALLVMNQYLISYWLGREVARVDSLSNYWGAGYEMIVFDDGKFVKLEDYTVVLLVGKFGSGIEFEPAPISTMMISYQENVLVIRVFANNIEKLFAIPSILDEREGVQVIDRDAKHSTLLMTYILENVDNNMEHFPTIVLPRNVNEFDKTPIVFKRAGNRLQLHKDRKTDDWILNVIKGHCPFKCVSVASK